MKTMLNYYELFFLIHRVLENGEQRNNCEIEYKVEASKQLQKIYMMMSNFSCFFYLFSVFCNHDVHFPILNLYFRFTLIPEYIFY